MIVELAAGVGTRRFALVRMTPACATEHTEHVCEGNPSACVCTAWTTPKNMISSTQVSASNVRHHSVLRSLEIRFNLLCSVYSVQDM